MLYAPPPAVYEAVASWVEEKYKLSRDNFVRPFWPDSDYQKFEYKPDCVVVDNPPFSILSPIVHWYMDKNIRFFLFAPGLQLGGILRQKCGIVYPGLSIEYENGAKVATAFATNLDENLLIQTAPDLKSKLVQAQPKEIKRKTYNRPYNIISPPHLCAIANYDFYVDKTGGEFVGCRPDKSQIYGGGLLLIDEYAKKYHELKKMHEMEKATKKYEDIFESSSN